MFERIEVRRLVHTTHPTTIQTQHTEWFYIHYAQPVIFKLVYL